MTKKTLTTTSPSVWAPSGGCESIGFEAAAVLASAGPLGIIAMGTFPLSLIALGRIWRRHFDDTLRLRTTKIAAGPTVKPDGERTGCHC